MMTWGIGVSGPKDVQLDTEGEQRRLAPGVPADICMMWMHPGVRLESTPKKHRLPKTESNDMYE
jgi:hypothetical protein